MAGKAKPPIDRFERMYIPEPNSGCWLWLGHIPKSGYGQFRLSTDPQDRAEGAHRAAWMLFNGEIPDGLQVCHRCDVRCCVNPQHLFLGTATENMQDAVRKGRMNWKQQVRPGLPRGEKHHSAKLTPKDVIAIRSLNINGVEAARKFGVAPTTVSRIRRNLVWQHLGGAT